METIEIPRKRGRKPNPDKQKKKQEYTESMKKSQANYRRRNLDKYNGYVMKYYEANKEACKERMRLYYRKKKLEQIN
jgi:ketopantoate reductase